jgi:hypothetical protein
MVVRMAHDEQLLTEFVDSFAKLDDMIVWNLDDAAPELQAGRIGNHDRWRPNRKQTDPEMLIPLYHRLRCRFPPLYERLVLSYRWLNVELELLELFGNPPEEGFNLLADQIFRDPIFVDVLIPQGFIPFGRAAGDNYDPICFDTKRPTIHDDYPIVRFEHESILCNGRIGDVEVIAPSFRSVVDEVIALAK